MSQFAHFFFIFFLLHKLRGGCLELSHVTKGVLAQGGGKCFLLSRVKQIFFPMVTSVQMALAHNFAWWTNFFYPDPQGG